MDGGDADVMDLKDERDPVPLRWSLGCNGWVLQTWRAHGAGGQPGNAKCKI